MKNIQSIEFYTGSKEELLPGFEKAGFITGENICIDGGMTKQMIYHGDCGWTLDMKI